ncbi:MAG: hypothetical protein KF696_12700 [Planctomycetes bacterium]|nr:hypothetical protein [Planctomycetota bacterium]MCW8135947.1 hypothetical protein [Planctomycetota bacterium]
MALLSVPVCAQAISVERPVGTSLTNGGTDNLGSKTGKGLMTLTYVVGNTDAGGNLNASGTWVTAPGSEASNVSWAIRFTDPISLAMGATSNVEVDVNPIDDGSFALNVYLATNDTAGNSNFQIRIRGSTGKKKKEEDDKCSTGNGTPFGLLGLLGVLCGLALVVRLRGSRA